MSSHMRGILVRAGDSPLAPITADVVPPTPIFSFCKTPEYSDIMIPNTIEGDVFVRPKDKRAFRRRSRAGMLHTASRVLAQSLPSLG
jgi:hypothetical protein